MPARPDVDAAGPSQSFGRRWVTPITVSLILVALTTMTLWVLAPNLKQDHLIFIYFVPTAMIAIRYGSMAAMGVTIASSLIAAYILYTPQFSFMVTSRLDVMELVLFGLLALLASQVVSGFAKDAGVEHRLRRRLRRARVRRRWFAGSLARLRSKFALR